MAGEMLCSQSGLSLLLGQLRVSHRVATSLPCRTSLQSLLPASSASSASRQSPSSSERVITRVVNTGAEPAASQAWQGTTWAASPARGASSTRVAASGAASAAASRAQTTTTTRGAASSSPSQTQRRGGGSPGTGERPPSLSAMASSNGWKLHCRRELQLQFPGTRESLEAYLAQPEQIVRVAFPDSSRLKQLGPTRWQARLKPVTFFHITATPVCTIRAWYEEDPTTGGRLRLTSEDLKLEFIGAPAELTRVRLRLLLDGHLQPLGSSSAGPRHTRAETSPGVGQAQRQGALTYSAPEGAGRGPASVAAGGRGAATGGGEGASLAGGGASCLAGGCVDLGVVIEELPLALTFIPPAMASQVGSAILAAILDAMKGALQNGLVRDFSVWQQRQARGTPTGAPGAALAGATPSAGAATSAAGVARSAGTPAYSTRSTGTRAAGVAGAGVARSSGVEGRGRAMGGSTVQTGR